MSVWHLQRHPEKNPFEKCDVDEKQWEIMAAADLNGGMLFARERKLMKTKDKAVNRQNVQQ